MTRTALAVFLMTFLATSGDQAVAPDDDDNAVLVVGVITDAEIQRPIGGARVFFTALDIGGLTQRDGNYTIREVPEEGQPARRLTGLRQSAIPGREILQR